MISTKLPAIATGPRTLDAQLSQLPPQPSPLLKNPILTDVSFHAEKAESQKENVSKNVLGTRNQAMSAPMVTAFLEIPKNVTSFTCALTVSQFD